MHALYMLYVIICHIVAVLYTVMTPLIDVHILTLGEVGVPCFLCSSKHTDLW